jgi:predicted HAD superfamily Cof-like phosphohydrolase
MPIFVKTKERENMTTYPSPFVLVETFQLTFGHSVRATPKIDVPERKLRISLLDEEVQELLTAVKEDDFIEVVDAIADILYVAYGAALCHGINIDHRMGNMDHISPSNQITRTLNSEKASMPTIPHLSSLALAKEVPSIVAAFKEYRTASDNGMVNELGNALVKIIFYCYALSKRLGVNIDEVMAEVQASNMSKLGEDGLPVKREDGKILKGPGFFHPNIPAILEKQGWISNH